MAVWAIGVLLTKYFSGVPVNFPMGLPDTLTHDMTGIDTGLDYETPEKIKLLHQLALQHVNQVCTIPM